MAAQIKLLFIIDCYKNPYAGTEGQLLKLIQGLERDKYEATFIVFRNSNFLKENEFPIPVDIVGIQRLVSPFSWLRLFKCFASKKKEGFKLAHIFFNDASMICPPLLKLLGYRVIISRRDMGYWYTGLNLFFLRFNALIVDYVIANSEAVKGITIYKEKYKANHIAVIYNGYFESGEPLTLGGLPENCSIDIGDSEIRIVLVANIRPIKRIADALQAINIVLGSEPRVTLYVIGDGDHSQLMKLSKELGIESSVRFPGARDDVLQLLPHFHVGILCSESEGFSNTLIEYMQSSLPVICSNVGGNSEIVEHGVNGFLYKMGDVPVLAKHILELAMDAGLCERMGRAGMDKVKDNYNLTKYVDQHQRLYDKLLSQ